MRKIPARWKSYCAFGRACARPVGATFGSAMAQALPRAIASRAFCSVVWGDPKPGVRVDVEHALHLTYPDGTRIPLNIGPACRTLRSSMSASACECEAIPRVYRDRSKSTSMPSKSRRPNHATGGHAAPARCCSFCSDSRATRSSRTPPTFFKNLTNPLTPPASIPATINGFFDKISYGKFKWMGDVAGVGGLNPTAWFTLPHNQDPLRQLRRQ